MSSVILRGGLRLYNVHPARSCVGHPCPIHNVTDHPMRQWPQEFIGGIMCRFDESTGIRYVDPDQPVNGVQCLRCKDKIRSLHRHDFVTCSCGNVSVDGGYEYDKRVWSGLSGYVELEPGDHEVPQ